jgi:hypothetical protein
MNNLLYVRKAIALLPQTNRNEGKRTLFVTIRSFGFILHQELFMANILARSGTKVTILLDDGQLKHWDTYQIHNKGVALNPYGSVKLRLQKSVLLALYSHRNIEIRYLSEFLQNEAYKSIEVNHGDEMNAVSSTRRYFESGGYDESSIEERAYYDASIDNIQKVKYAVSELHGKNHYNAVITSHGIYSLWGGAYDFFKQLRIPIYMYGVHVYRDSHIQFSDTIGQTLALDTSWTNFRKKPFNLDQRKKVDDFFISRRQHTTKDTSIYYSWMKDFESFKVEKKENSRTFAIFPNIIWDGDVAQRDTIFNGMFDYLCYTVQYFIKHPKDNLIIRVHPAEATLYQDTPGVNKLIHERFPNIDSIKNIHIIQADQRIDTYSFAKENIDAALVYDSILTLEMTHLGIPVISPSCSRYTCDSFVIVPKTLAEFDSVLETMSFKDYLNKERLDDFYKYSYWHLFDAAYIMPFYSTGEYEKLDISKNSLEKMKDPDFVKFIDKIYSIFK